MQSIPLVRRAALAAAVSFLEKEGVPLRRHLSRARLTIPSPADAETLMPLYQLCDFLSSVARAEGIGDLGFRTHLGVEELGTFGRLIAQGFTLHESVQISMDLIATYNSGLRIWIERHHDQVRYCQKYADSIPRSRIEQVVHLALQNAMVMASCLAGERWKLNRIELASDPIDLSKYFSELAHIPVSFGQPFSSIWMSASVMSAPVGRLEVLPPVDRKTREAYLDSGPASQPIGQMEQVIESVLHRPGADLQLMAASIGTSARTLQRRLREADLTFSRLLQQVRFRGAQRLLRDPALPVNEVARGLGYADPANFIRAFKRWTGVGPSQFRRLHYEPTRE